MRDRGTEPDSTQDFLRFLAGALVVLVVVYTGFLLFFLISGPRIDEVEALRKIAFITLLGCVVAWATLLFVGSRFYTVGPLPEAATPSPEEPVDKGAAAPVQLSLSDEAEDIQPT